MAIILQSRVEGNVDDDLQDKHSQDQQFSVFLNEAQERSSYFVN